MVAVDASLSGPEEVASRVQLSPSGRVGVAEKRVMTAPRFSYCETDSKTTRELKLPAMSSWWDARDMWGNE
jgi:hypothetical protein